MDCSACGCDNRAGARFCRGCGAGLAATCPQCRAGLLPEARFCDACGCRIAEVEAPRSVPAEPATRRSPAPAADERKTVTVLFADMKGYTALAEALDPEETRRLIDPTLEVMVEAVRRFDGFVSQSTGDGILALFGAPVAHEDHAQRALHAALLMQEGIQRRAGASGRPIQIRVGINTGEVVMRSISKDSERFEYTPVGHAINLASRFESLAEPGAILAGAETWALAEGYFRFRALEPIVVKGVREPVTAYEVLGLGPLRTRLEMAARRGLARFVGRASELERMLAALARTRNGAGEIVALMGEPGLGKSRLCFEFKQRCLADCRVLETFSVSHGKAYPYLPLIALLKDYFGWRDDDDESERRRKATQAVTALDPELEDSLPYLFHLLGVAGPLPVLAQMDPEIRRRRVFEAIERLLRRESAVQPLVLMFEDLQWLDSETLAFLAALARGLAASRILLLVNYRPEYREPFWSAHGAVTELRLTPLEGGDGEALLSALLGDGAALLPLKQRVLRETGCNPFFIEEIVRSLFDRGILIHDRAAATLTRPLDEIKLPATVQGVVAARIDRLQAEEKLLLQLVAVIGRELDLGLVAKVAGNPADEVRRVLARLIDAGFVNPPAETHGRYELKHAITQEVAYGLLLKERRQALHERTAQAIESLFAAGLAEYYGELAHHYGRSGNAAKAIEYLRLAGQQSVQRSANEQAIVQLSHALELLAQLPDTAQRAQAELSLQLAIGSPLMRIKGWAAAEVGRARGRALELCRGIDGSPQLFPVLFGLWGYSLVRAEIKNALALGEQLASLAESLGDDGLIVEACRALGAIWYFTGDLPRARQWLERGAKIYDRERHAAHAAVFGQDPGVTALSYLAVALALMGEPELARQRNDEALQLAEAIGHPYTTAFAWYFAGTLYHRLDEPEAVMHWAERTIALCDEHGFPLWRSGAVILRGWARGRQGSAEQGLAEIREGIAAWRATGAEIARPYFQAMLAQVCAAAGRDAEALTAAEEGLALGEANGERWWSAGLLRLKGEALAVGGAADAQSWIEEALILARTQGARIFEQRAAKSLARQAAINGELCGGSASGVVGRLQHQAVALQDVDQEAVRRAP